VGTVKGNEFGWHPHGIYSPFDYGREHPDPSRKKSKVKALDIYDQANVNEYIR
jgi:hypothetical protein